MTTDAPPPPETSGAPGAPSAADVLAGKAGHEPGDHKVPGTVVLTFVLLASFAVYYFANWKALADAWHVR